MGNKICITIINSLHEIAKVEIAYTLQVRVISHFFKF